MEAQSENKQLKTWQRAGQQQKKQQRPSSKLAELGRGLRAKARSRARTDKSQPAPSRPPRAEEACVAAPTPQRQNDRTEPTSQRQEGRQTRPTTYPDKPWLQQKRGTDPGTEDAVNAITCCSQTATGDEHFRCVQGRNTMDQAPNRNQCYIATVLLQQAFKSCDSEIPMQIPTVRIFQVTCLHSPSSKPNPQKHFLVIRIQMI